MDDGLVEAEGGGGADAEVRGRRMLALGFLQQGRRRQLAGDPAGLMRLVEHAALTKASLRMGASSAAWSGGAATSGLLALRTAGGLSPRFARFQP